MVKLDFILECLFIYKVLWYGGIKNEILIVKMSKKSF